MSAVAWFRGAERVLGAPGVLSRTVDRDGWQLAAAELAAAKARLLALWASGNPTSGGTVRAVLAAGPGVLVLTLPKIAGRRSFPSIAKEFPAAARMERAVTDMNGFTCLGVDRRPWLRHAVWPKDFYPLAQSELPLPAAERPVDDYPFVRVQGDGVHEIAVGPVHAGIIEPGHFRCTVVGEKILRLEARLGYVHKGVERRFTELGVLEAHRLAARVSGDSTVAFSWAYCQALEGISAVAVPKRALWLRALALELERVANHLGDLGALGNDAGLAFALSQFSRLKELLLRSVARAFGQRYLFDFIVPGGTHTDLDAAGTLQLGAALTEIMQNVGELRDIIDNHAGVRDRFVGTGIVAPALAARLGLVGLAGRASGLPFDLRIDLPCEPYAELAPRKMVRQEGDVAARVAVRFDELFECCRLGQSLLDRLPAGAHREAVPLPPAGSFGLGLIEGWRGPVLVGLESGPNGNVLRCHPHDPSWQNWPVVEHAVLGNIVPDFPLINKSFNLSYSGHDL